MVKLGLGPQPVAVFSAVFSVTLRMPFSLAGNSGSSFVGGAALTVSSETALTVLPAPCLSE